MTSRSSPPAASPASSASRSSLHLVVLASREGWHTRELTRALTARGHTGTIVPYESLVASIGGRPGLRAGKEDLERADAVLTRIIPSGSLEQIIFRVDALHCLEERGVRVMNSARAIERTVDKLWTSALLERCGLPTPRTVVCETAEEAMAAFRALGDVIVKPLFGSMGLGMVRVSDEEMAFRVFRTIEQIRGVYYLQQTVDHEGRDVRAFVIGGKVFGAIERRSDGWRTNLARGGSAKPFALPPEWAAMAVRAAAAVGAEYAGVDLLPGRDGTVSVLEVNGIPGWQGLQEATGLDVALALIDQLVSPRA
jgi:RimK family alpha-L-glutamate ligase